MSTRLSCAHFAGAWYHVLMRSWPYAGMSDANPHAPTTVNGITYTYNNNNNLTSAGSQKYSWDYRNRLITAGNGSATSTYGYDYLNQRVRKVFQNATTTYPNKYMSKSISGSLSTTTDYIYMGDTIIAEVAVGSSTTSGGVVTLPITLDATTTNITIGLVGTTTKTWTHTVSGPNPIIVLSADIFQDVGGIGTIASATWGGDSFTHASSTETGTKWAEMWYLVASTTGSRTISVTVNGNTRALKFNAASFKNVARTSPLDVIASSNGSSGNPSVSLTTLTSGDVVIATLDRHTTADATTSATALYKDEVQSTLGAASYQLATTTGLYTDTYTGTTTQNWAMIMAAFKAATTTSVVPVATTTRYFLPDQLNNTNVVTDASGTVLQVLDFYPYGSTRVSQQTSGFNEQKQFIGQYEDPETNLSYLQARYYDGSKGEFLSEDPVFLGDPRQQVLTDPQSLNSYSYASDNPIAKSDPTGKCIYDGCAVEAVAALGFAGGIATQAFHDYSTGDFSRRSVGQNISTYALAGTAGAAVSAGIAIAGDRGCNREWVERWRAHHAAGSAGTQGSRGATRWSSLWFLFLMEDFFQCGGCHF
jgi:RHS repeat-associated protein